MGRLTEDTIGGFNSFVESQKDDTKTTLTTVMFDYSCKTFHDGLDVYEIEPMTKKDYIPGGGTAMLDAIGETINTVQDRHDDMGDAKPDNVLFVITTDGEENSSKKFTKTDIERMIKHQTNGHGWEFIFLGANMDAVKEATSIGIDATKSVSYAWDSRGTDALYGTVTAAACSVKNCTIDGLDLAKTYSDCLSNVDGVVDCLGTGVSAKYDVGDVDIKAEVGSKSYTDCVADLSSHYE